MKFQLGQISIFWSSHCTNLYDLLDLIFNTARCGLMLGDKTLIKRVTFIVLVQYFVSLFRTFSFFLRVFVTKKVTFNSIFEDQLNRTKFFIFATLSSYLHK